MVLDEKYQVLLSASADLPEREQDGMRLCFEILALARSIDADCAAKLGTFSLSEAKFLLLFLLDQADKPLKPHRLATLAGVTRATVTGLLDGLERDGLVERHVNDTDRRSVDIALTPKGRTVIAEAGTVHRRWIASLFGHLSTADVDCLMRLLPVLRARLSPRSGEFDALSQ
ncbi:MarR family transcriptional regulator [Rhizobium sp. CFBP 8762]|uniref:MarR family winged helix-turn-helix transcriptional regulator n=1 Tax=Rhizobium sp. CFBP 8762 TaxID=2775279 RepID=UPI00177F7E05|nr:MarR family transcriptional regulator [Rhizobium sp. CFBP 8762]MBD8555233.1 MarR family transcriptional regulator [Rhizobium sp. CFBP 8762]